MTLVQTDAQYRRILFILVLIGFIVRVLAVLALDDYRHPLTAEYGIVAQNLLAGRGFTGGGWLGPEAPTALNVPIYPLFLAAWLGIGRDLPFLWIELSQALFSALMIYLVAQIALHLSNRLTGLIAGALTALYPPLIYYPKQVSPAILSAFFAAIALYVLLMLLEKPTWTRAGVTGILSGLALHVEPVLLLALPGTTLFETVFFSRLPWRMIGGKLLVAAAVCGMVLIPWAIRNLVVFQQWVPFKTSFGLNLWMGNNPQATGMLYTTDGTPMQDTLSLELREHLATLNEAQRYSALAQRAWMWIQEHPGRFLQLTAVRIRYLWWISPTYQTTAEAIVEPQFFYEARMWTQAVVVVLGFAGGLVALLRNRRLLVHCLWWMAAFTVPYAITVAGNTRYRLPAEPMVLILIAFGLAEGIRRIAASDQSVQPIEVRLW